MRSQIRNGIIANSSRTGPVVPGVILFLPFVLLIIPLGRKAFNGINSHIQHSLGLLGHPVFRKGVRDRRKNCNSKNQLEFWDTRELGTKVTREWNMLFPILRATALLLIHIQIPAQHRSPENYSEMLSPCFLQILSLLLQLFYQKYQGQKASLLLLAYTVTRWSYDG